MLRKTIVVLAAAASIGGTVALTTTTASAHGWYGGHYRFAYGYRQFGFYPRVAFYGSYGCWRWVPTYWGWRRGWAC